MHMNEALLQFAAAAGGGFGAGVLALLVDKIYQRWSGSRRRAWLATMLLAELKTVDRALTRTIEVPLAARRSWFHLPVLSKALDRVDVLGDEVVVGLVEFAWLVHRVVTETEECAARRKRESGVAEHYRRLIASLAFSACTVLRKRLVPKLVESGGRMPRALPEVTVESDQDLQGQLRAQLPPDPFLSGGNEGTSAASPAR